jgi:acyl-CoA thioesterase-1
VTPVLDEQTTNDQLGCARRGAGGRVRSARRARIVDCYSPLLGHDQWQSDLAASAVPHHPGQAGYGLIAWLVLHNGWNEWLGL